MGHEENFREWLTIHGSCPVCRIEYEEQLFEEILLEDGTVQQLYIEKSSIYFKRQQIFNQFSFQYPYYDFQNTILQDILSQLRFDRSHLLISPPGSGKTIIGLATASHFSTNTLVLTPNLAVLGSWIDRLSMFYDAEASELPIDEVYTRSKGSLRPITITTYQQINTSLRQLKEDSTSNNSKQAKGKLLLKEPRNFIDRILDHDIGMVILDEAHRLTGKWGRDIYQLLQKIGDVKILGLTATPPQRIDEEFEQLFSDRKTEIPLPMLVRAEVLVPYRDYSILLPSRAEMLNDLLLIAESQSQEKQKILKELIDRTKEEINYLNTNYDQIYNQDYQFRWLSSNLSVKTALAIIIVVHEYQQLGDHFRGLILTDQENIPSNYKLDPRGNRGVIGIFEDILQVPEIDILDPVFVTGKSLVIDEDFTETFYQKGMKWAKMFGLEINIEIKRTKKKYAIVNGSGEDWNTDTYTRFVTYLFESGITKLLLGTKFLLGEGWDSQSLNTLIDLTTFATYASVNQAKGRALRFDPHWKEKVSNLWEIAPNPNLTPFSVKNYEHYTERHQVYFGIDGQGNIRNGVDRLNPSLREKNVKSMQFYDQLQDLLQRSSQRSKAVELWKVGEKLGDLFYTIRFNMLPPNTDYIITPHEFQSSVELAIKTLVRTYFGYECDIIVKLVEEGIVKIRIAIPMAEEYDKIVYFVDLLENKSADTGIGIYIQGYDKIPQSFWQSLLRWIKNDPHEVIVSTKLIVFPWPISIIDSQDIINSSTIQTFTPYHIQDIGNRVDPNIIAPIGRNNDDFQIRIKYFDYSELSLVQYFSEIKGIEKTSKYYPIADEYLKPIRSDIILDQQYIDLEGPIQG